MISNKKIYKLVIIISVIILASSLYVMRFLQLNNSYTPQTILRKGIEQPVSLDCFDLEVKNSKMLDVSDFSNTYTVTKEEKESLAAYSQKVLLIQVNVKYTGNNKKEVVNQLNNFVSKCGLESGAFFNNVDIGLLTAVNNTKEVTEKISQGEGMLVLPFTLPENQFKASSWNAISNREFHLTIGYYPQKIMIKIL